MTDLVPTILPKLLNNHLPDLALGEGSICPDYAGRSILNIPASVCHMLGVPPIAGQMLHPDLLEPLGNGIRHVILILMDALALHRLQRWISDGSTPVWNQLMQEGLLAPITSITPSTTSAALTTLWSGRSVTEHAVTGYEMWMKEYGMVVNTILHSAISYKNDMGGLERAGFEPEKALPFPTLGTHFKEHGIHTYAMQHASILRSGLSKMLFKDVEVQAFYSAADLWVNLRHLFQEKYRQPFFTWVYWSAVDHFGHLYGPDDERTVQEFVFFSQAMQKLFLESLNTAARHDTLLILTADHGQIATQSNARYELQSHPELAHRLHINPTGENRLTYLYPRAGQFKAVQDYLMHAWPDQLVILETDQAIQKGLFGPGKAHPALRDRLGDLVIIWRNNAYLWWSEKENILLGRHGGMHADEMLVPFLAVRL